MPPTHLHYCGPKRRLRHITCSVEDVFAFKWNCTVIGIMWSSWRMQGSNKKEPTGLTSTVEAKLLQNVGCEIGPVDTAGSSRYPIPHTPVRFCRARSLSSSPFYTQQAQ